MKVLLFGIQGSGKSTIGRYLASKYGVPFIAIGDILRKLREEDSETGRLIKNTIDQGHFIPDELAMKVINERLEEEDAKDGFILDGAPRNLTQEKLFKQELDLAIIVNLDEEEAFRRLLGRGRHDDSHETIKKRMDWHKENTQPLIEFYRSKGVKIIEVDNTPNEEEVRRNLDELLKN